MPRVAKGGGHRWSDLMKWRFISTYSSVVSLTLYGIHARRWVQRNVKWASLGTYDRRDRDDSDTFRLSKP